MKNDVIVVYCGLMVHSTDAMSMIHTHSRHKSIKMVSHTVVEHYRIGVCAS